MANKTLYLRANTSGITNRFMKEKPSNLDYTKLTRTLKGEFSDIIDIVYYTFNSYYTGNTAIFSFNNDYGLPIGYLLFFVDGPWDTVDWTYFGYKEFHDSDGSTYIGFTDCDENGNSRTGSSYSSFKSIFIGDTYSAQQFLDYLSQNYSYNTNEYSLYNIQYDNDDMCTVYRNDSSADFIYLGDIPFKDTRFSLVYLEKGKAFYKNRELIIENSEYCPFNHINSNVYMQPGRNDITAYKYMSPDYQWNKQTKIYLKDLEEYSNINQDINIKFNYYIDDYTPIHYAIFRSSDSCNYFLKIFNESSVDLYTEDNKIYYNGTMIGNSNYIYDAVYISSTSSNYESIRNGYFYMTSNRTYSFNIRGDWTLFETDLESITLDGIEMVADNTKYETPVEIPDYYFNYRQEYYTRYSFGKYYGYIPDSSNPVLQKTFRLFNKYNLRFYMNGNLPNQNTFKYMLFYNPDSKVYALYFGAIDNDYFSEITHDFYLQDQINESKDYLPYNTLYMMTEDLTLEELNTNYKTQLPEQSSLNLSFDNYVYILEENMYNELTCSSYELSWYRFKTWYMQYYNKIKPEACRLVDTNIERNLYGAEWFYNSGYHEGSEYTYIDLKANYIPPVPPEEKTDIEIKYNLYQESISSENNLHLLLSYKNDTTLMEDIYINPSNISSEVSISNYTCDIGSEFSVEILNTNKYRFIDDSIRFSATVHKDTDIYIPRIIKYEPSPGPTPTPTGTPINKQLHELLNEIIGKGPESVSDKYFIYKIKRIFPKYLYADLKELDEDTGTLTLVEPVKRTNEYKIYHLYEGKYYIICSSEDSTRITYYLEVTKDMYGKYDFKNITLEGGKFVDA